MVHQPLCEHRSAEHDLSRTLLRSIRAGWEVPDQVHLRCSRAASLSVDGNENWDRRPTSQDDMEGKMPIKLKFAEITRSTSTTARQRSPRDVIVGALSEQIALAQATMRGETLKVERQVYKKGEKGKVAKTVTGGSKRTGSSSANSASGTAPSICPVRT